MTRIIKFKGKTVNDSKWVYGAIHFIDKKYYIGNNEFIMSDITDDYYLDSDLVEVYNDSVGQYINYSDNSGVEMYEGDKVKYRWNVIHGPNEHGEGFVYFDEESAQYLIDIDSQLTILELDYIEVVSTRITHKG